MNLKKKRKFILKKKNFPLSLSSENDAFGGELEDTVFNDNWKSRELGFGTVETVEHMDHAWAIVVEQIVT